MPTEEDTAVRQENLRILEGNSSSPACAGSRFCNARGMIEAPDCHHMKAVIQGWNIQKYEPSWLTQVWTQSSLWCHIVASTWVFVRGSTSSGFTRNIDST